MNLSNSFSRNCQRFNSAIIFAFVGTSFSSNLRIFENFLESENPNMHSVGMQLYAEYLRFGGIELGGRFARIDANFAEFYRQHGR